MKSLRKFWYLIIAAALVIMILIIYLSKSRRPETDNLSQADKKNFYWVPPDTATIPDNQEGELIRYGRQLITNTAYYIGPKGKVLHISNGMNCGNCHIAGGTKDFGNNFSAVASTYPQFRKRSGKVESITFRINGCMERSLNGKPLQDSGREMLAMIAYLKWLGQKVPQGVKPENAGIKELPELARAADTASGKQVYNNKCMVCHGKNGEGKLSTDSIVYTYPPLWGPHSYNVSAGLYRLSDFAGYVRSNMPFGTTYKNPQLTVAEAWDVAAFVNSQPRPVKFFSSDWPKIADKSYDYPFGPYADSFSQSQHKYGPYLPIKNAKASHKQ